MATAKVILPQWNKLSREQRGPITVGSESTVVQTVAYRSMFLEEKYDVYEMEVTGTGVSTLEEVFHALNMEHPANYKHRSLSVGDLVKLDGKVWRCAMIGWVDVTEVLKLGKLDW